MAASVVAGAAGAAVTGAIKKKQDAEARRNAAAERKLNEESAARIRGGCCSMCRGSGLAPLGMGAGLSPVNVANTQRQQAIGSLGTGLSKKGTRGQGLFPLGVRPR